MISKTLDAHRQCVAEAERIPLARERAELRRRWQELRIERRPTWLDSWSGIGRIAVGMHRQGFDLQLTQYDERGWRATFIRPG